MSFVGSQMSQTMQGVGTGLGLLGTDFPKVCQAVGNGLAQAIPKATYQSILLVGTGPGSGTTETGVGMVILPGTVAPVLIAKVTAAMGSIGTGIPLIAAALEQAFITAALTIQATGTAPGVTAGTSKIVAISAVDEDWGASVLQAGLAAGLAGTSWPDLAKAIGAACATGFKAAIATPAPVLVIEGVPAGVQAPVSAIQGSGAFS